MMCLTKLHYLTLLMLLTVLIKLLNINKITLPPVGANVG